MDDAQLNRYSRQILLPEIDLAGQEKLLQSHVLIIGAGGLGSPAALYLAGSGIGQLTLSDDDQVDLSNLQRQILHHSSDIGRPKVDSARESLSALNPTIKIHSIDQRLSGDRLLEQVRQADAVIDGSDNFPSRYRLNKACLSAHKPLVSGAVTGMEGQASVFRHDLEEAPCLECLFPRQDQQNQQGGCSDQGILGPVAGVIGSILAIESIKILLNIGDSLTGRLLLFNARTMQFRQLNLSKDPHCPACVETKH